MASRANTLIPPERHPPTKGTMIFSYTFAGLTATAIIVVVIIFCKYRVRRRAPVVTTGAGRVAEGNPEERRPVSVDIAKLPEFSYTESARRRGGGDGAHCSVCLGAVQPGEKVRRLPLCKHLYHVECIDMWLASHTTCPLCRADVEQPGDEYKVARGWSIRSKRCRYSNWCQTPVSLSTGNVAL